MNKQVFIEKANKIHNNKYDYSLINYKNSYSKINIICTKHGAFLQRANNHLRGTGCPYCNNINIAKRFLRTTEEFIKKASVIHKNKYDYSTVNYIKYDIPVSIICPVHGIFLQKPIHHIARKRGCPKCGWQKNGVKNRKKNSYWINKFKNTHGNYYDYSKFENNGRKNKAVIICPIHGEFNQTPEKHERGDGCILCNSSIGEKRIEQTLNSIKIKFIKEKTFNDLYTTGITGYNGYPRFDFYLPELNICIEYDGPQHFKYYSNFKGIKNKIYNFNNWKITRINDKIKNEYCKINNIELIRIRYTQLKNIEKILNERFIRVS